MLPRESNSLTVADHVPGTPRGHTVVLGVAATVERHAGWKIMAKGRHRETVRPSKAYVMHCLGLKWGSMMLWVSVTWAQHICAGIEPCIALRPSAPWLAWSQTLEGSSPVKPAVLGKLP